MENIKNNYGTAGADMVIDHSENSMERSDASDINRNNHFFIDSSHLSEEALAKKHRLESDPASRRDHMEYLPGMEQIESDI